MSNFVRCVLISSFLLLPFSTISQEAPLDVNNKLHLLDTPKRLWPAAGEVVASNLAT